MDSIYSNRSDDSQFSLRSDGIGPSSQVQDVFGEGALTVLMGDVIVEHASYGVNVRLCRAFRLWTGHWVFCPDIKKICMLQWHSVSSTYVLHVIRSGTSRKSRPSKRCKQWK